MEPGSLLGVWTGIARNSNGWDMKITLSILQPVEVGVTLGIFDIPLIPCSGALRVIAIEGETLALEAEKVQGDCEPADAESLELLADGSLLYRSRGKGWTAQGVLRPLS